MLSRVQPQKALDDEARGRPVSDRHFLGLSLADTLPDETVLVRFRKRLLKANLAEALFTTVLTQVEAADRRKKRRRWRTRWAVKNGKPVAHGFKAHIAADDGSEIVRAIITTNGAQPPRGQGSGQGRTPLCRREDTPVAGPTPA